MTSIKKTDLVDMVEGKFRWCGDVVDVIISSMLPTRNVNWHEIFIVIFIVMSFWIDQNFLQNRCDQ